MSEKARARVSGVEPLGVRLPHRYVWAAYLERVPTIVGLVVIGSVAVQRPDAWLGTWAVVLIACLLAARLVEPPYRAATVSMVLSARGVTVAAGWLFRRSRSLAWSDVGAVDVETPWAYRPFGLVRVTLAQAGEEATQIVLVAADARTLAQVRKLSGSAAAKEQPVTEPDHPGGDGSPRVNEGIYRASLTDLLIAGFVYGQFAVGGTAAALAAWDLLDTAGLSNTALQAFSAGPLVLGAVAVVVLVLTGFALTVVRFAGFEVRIRRSTSVVIRYGMLVRVERTIAPDVIAGVMLQANVVERILGRVRLILLTTDSAAGLGSNLVLPSLPPAVVSRVLAELVPDAPAQAPAHVARGGVLRGLLVAFATVLPAVAVVVLVSVGEAPRLLVVVAAAVALAGTYAIGRLLCTLLSFEQEAALLSLSTSHISDRRSLLRPDAIHLVSAVAVLSRPVLVRALYYAGMSRAATAARFAATDVEVLRAHLTRSRQPGRTTQAVETRGG